MVTQRNDVSTMSQHVVEAFIARLLLDEVLRARFVIEPMETLADLHGCGFELSSAEIDLFMQADARTWFWTSAHAISNTH
jgi:hypothetical protein